SLVPDIEVIVREAAPLVRQDPVVGILGGIFRHADPKRPALFHALEDEVDSVGIILHEMTYRLQAVMFFANAVLSPFDRDLVVAGVGLYPTLVIVGALAKNFLAHHRNAEDLANEMNHLLGPREPVQVAIDDNSVK